MTNNLVFAPASDRGFLKADFYDRYESPCSIQESSLASEPCIWLGVTAAGGRMHLTQDMVRALLPALNHFVAHGDLRVKEGDTSNVRINEFAEALVARIVGIPGSDIRLLLDDVIRAIRKEAARPAYQEPKATNYVSRFLDLSTAHLDLSAKAWLDNQSERNTDAHNIGLPNHTGGEISTLGATMFGYFTHVPEFGADDDRPYTFPASLETVFRKAHELGLSYILFDADADAMEGLPTYDDEGNRDDDDFQADYDWPDYEWPLDALQKPFADRFTVQLPGEDRHAISDADYNRAYRVVTASGKVLKDQYESQDDVIDVRTILSTARPREHVHIDDGGLADELAEPGELDSLTKQISEIHGIAVMLRKAGVDAKLISLVGERLERASRQRMEIRRKYSAIRKEAATFIAAIEKIDRG